MRVRVGRHQRQAAPHRFAGRHTDFYGLDPEAWAQEGLVDRILPWGVIFAACRRPTWTTTAAWSRGRRQSCGRTCDCGTTAPTRFATEELRVATIPETHPEQIMTDPYTKHHFIWHG